MSSNSNLAELDPALQTRLARIRLLAMDVDGVLTDGSLTYDDSGGEQKRFHVADGLGLTVLRLMGYSIAWISGRDSPSVKRRADELKIPHLFAGARDKHKVLLKLLAAQNLSPDEVAYIGDDWNDLPAFEAVGVRIAAANAVPDVKAKADWTTRLAGGHGAVREACEALLDATGQREEALRRYLKLLEDESAGRDSTQ